MYILEIGAFASAIIAVISLITKIVDLISAMQKLMLRIDSIQEDLLIQQQATKDLDHLLQQHALKISRFDYLLEAIRSELITIKDHIKELQAYAIA